MKNIKKVFFLAVLAVFIAPLSFGATLNSVSKKQLEQAFVNKTAVSIDVEQPNGTPISNPFAMFLDSKGKIWAIMSNQPASGPQTDEGTYTIGRDGTLYLQWQHWFQAKKLCARLFETKNSYIVLGCDNAFQTVFMKDAIQTGKQF